MLGVVDQGELALRRDQFDDLLEVAIRLVQAGEGTTTEAPDIDTAIPDLNGIPVERLGELGGSALAHAIAEYRTRMREDDVPLSSFQARI